MLNNKYCTLFFFFSLMTVQLSAQKELPAVDTVYGKNIRTVQFADVLDGQGDVIITLKTDETLKLHFDDLDADVKNYAYTVEQCDRDWKPSRLDKIDYLEALETDRIRQYVHAQSTNIQFTNYRVEIPNDVIRFSKSGNYMLHVYIDDGEKTPVLSRRFVVSEPIVVITTIPAAASAIYFNTHQDIHFQIDPKTFRIQNPMNDIRSTVLQNGRWDNAYISRTPEYVMGDKIVYDQIDSLLFPAGREWRYVDVRSTRYRSERVNRIIPGEDSWEFLLIPDLDRSRQPYIFYPDLNGRFFIETLDYNQGAISVIGGNSNSTTLPAPTPSATVNNQAQSDYVNTFFSFKNQELENKDVYIFGALTDWKLDERFKLKYDENASVYKINVFLKQGFYNYEYVTVPKGSKKFDLSELEGDWYATQNDYTVIVYHRPFGARYDRVIGVLKFTSQPR